MQEYYIKSPFPPLLSVFSQSSRSQFTDFYLLISTYIGVIEACWACSICGYVTETHICLVYFDLFLLNAMLCGHVSRVHESLTWR
jgi:hypothetical protein